MPFWNVGTTNEIAVIVWRIVRALINALEGQAVVEGKIMKAIRKVPINFGYMELYQNQERAVHEFMRGSNDR